MNNNTDRTNKPLLRFITSGSVDDGKSTLIGRLLYDSKALLNDQINLLNANSNNKTLNLASLIDGLESEIEQGITIDVAYRYFNTKKRKFIIADTPGHEQYTRNMATGACNADAAIILIDASRINFKQEPIQLLPQTKRHSILLKYLDCKHIIVAINKLDLLNYDKKIFDKLIETYQKLSLNLGFKNVYYIPICALHGDNIVNKSINMPWYMGPTLLNLLENLPTEADINLNNKNSIFPVQRVIVQNKNLIDQFRGYQGKIESGCFITGQKVRIEPKGIHSRIKSIYSPNALVQKAKILDSITIELEDDIDISRGDTIVNYECENLLTKNIICYLCWFDEHRLNINKKYWLKHCTNMVYAKIKKVEYIIDINNFSHNKNVNYLSLNDIGKVQISLFKPLFAQTYNTNKTTGSFILIDEVNNHTAAAGMIIKLL